eukprot:8614389-Heterocapsa_arctica.AAC.1
MALPAAQPTARAAGRSPAARARNGRGSSSRAGPCGRATRAESLRQRLNLDTRRRPQRPRSSPRPPPSRSAHRDHAGGIRPN